MGWTTPIYTHRPLDYHVTTVDVHVDMLAHQDKYDRSNYPPDYPLHFNANKKVIGKFKDETAGSPIQEFVSLRAKMYSFALDDRKEKKAAKGTKKSVAEKEIRHKDYKDCLFSQLLQQHCMMGFRSNCHEIFTEKLTKTSLSPYDDKRYILEDGIKTLA